MKCENSESNSARGYLKCPSSTTATKCFAVSESKKHEVKELSTESRYKSELYELQGFVDWKGRPARKDRHGGKRSTLFVYVMAGMDNLAFVGIMPPIPISVFWLGFPLFVAGIVDLFTVVGMLEFFYSEAPATMRSFATSFTYASLSLGYFLSSVFVNIVNAATRNMTKSHGWIGGNNLNRNNLDLFYWFLVIVKCSNSHSITIYLIIPTTQFLKCSL
ncbi:hypothetical protein SUGI_0637400 [Cryptomeria japonica]|nr:hypothetical protein SUGI_0637400 [Cryptomeria japonica]